MLEREGRQLFCSSSNQQRESRLEFSRRYFSWFHLLGRGDWKPARAITSSSSRPCQFSRVSTHHLEWRYYLFLNIQLVKTQILYQRFHSGVATLNSSEELSKITIITITFTSEIFSLVWNNFAWKGRGGWKPVRAITSSSEIILFGREGR